MLHESHFSICSASVLGIEEISILAQYLALFSNHRDRFENRSISCSITHLPCFATPLNASNNHEK
jgi:hypothetical protein